VGGGRILGEEQPQIGEERCPAELRRHQPGDADTLGEREHPGRTQSRREVGVIGNRRPDELRGKRAGGRGQIEPEAGSAAAALDRGWHLCAEAIEQRPGTQVADRGRRVLLVRVRLREHPHDHVDVVLEVTPDRVRLRGQQRAVVLARQVEQRLPEHPGTAAVDENAVVERLAGGGPGLHQFVQIGQNELIRRSPVYHPAQGQVNIPANHRAPVHRPEETRISGQPTDSSLHPAYDHGDVETLQNAPQITV